MTIKSEAVKAETRSFFIGLSNRMSLTVRILLVNVIAILVFIAGLLFLDSYRERLIQERANATESAANMIAEVAELPGNAIAAVIVAEARSNNSRVRVYARNGDKVLDSAEEGETGFALRASETSLLKRAARRLDLFVDGLLLRARPKNYREPSQDILTAWPNLARLQQGEGGSQLFYAPDASPVFVGQARSDDGAHFILVTRNPKEVRTLIRAQRFNILAATGLALLVSVAMSLFLARTLVTPLRELMLAAVKVRRGRAREVSVPRLPQRRDEIGLLARALSDMSQSLRDRIDATEAFAADVAHEIKNPLASLRSALESIRRIDDPKLRAELLAVAEDDVQRMDRLISDISEASRVDSELSRARFEPVDVGCMIEQIVTAREARPTLGQAQRGVTFAYARPRSGSAIVMGEDMRLARVLDNLIDNAVSFSPTGGVVEIVATVTGQQVLIRVQDEGPGVAAKDADAIFHRFHTNRPPTDNGLLMERHSGLGLAIARTIVEGHLGHIRVAHREDGGSGAVFEVRLPCADCEETG